MLERERNGERPETWVNLEELLQRVFNCASTSFKNVVASLKGLERSDLYFTKISQ